MGAGMLPCGSIGCWIKGSAASVVRTAESRLVAMWALALVCQSARDGWVERRDSGSQVGRQCTSNVGSAVEGPGSEFCSSMGFGQGVGVVARAASVQESACAVMPFAGCHWMRYSV